MLIDYQKANVYQADDSVLNDVNFQVDADQFVYVIGKVGSGKSSLLKTIYCEVDFDKDDAEKAEVLGRNLLNIKRREIPALRREMGIIFQDFQLLHDRNVYRNLEFVLHSTGWKSSKQIAERIEQVLEAVGMQDMKLRLPHELSGANSNALPSHAPCSTVRRLSSQTSLPETSILRQLRRLLVCSTKSAIRAQPSFSLHITTDS